MKLEDKESEKGLTAQCEVIPSQHKREKWLEAHLWEMGVEEPVSLFRYRRHLWT